MKGLPLSDMKKISEDHQSATFKHKDGHTIKIATKALSPDMKKKLALLPIHAAKGTGVLEDPDDTNPANIAVESAGFTPAGDSPETSAAAAAQDKLRQQTYNSSFDSSKQWAPDMYNKDLEAAKSTPPPGYIGRGLNPKAPVQVSSGATGSFGDDTQDDQTSDDTESPSQPDPAQQSSSPLGQPAQPSTDMGPPMADKQNPIPGKSVEYTQAYDAFQKQHAQEFAQEDAAFDHDMQSGHITPKTYADLMPKGALGKIGTLFAMMVGGAGAGLSHQPNAILEMMNKELANDLEAQSKSKTNAQNLIQLNNQHEFQKAQQGLIGAQTASAQYNLARMKANRIALQHIVDQVKKYPAGTDDRQREQTLGMLYQSVNNENFDLGNRAAAAEAFNKVMGFGGGQQPGQDSEQSFQHRTQLLKSGMFGPEGINRGKDMEAKHIAGFAGQASEDMTPTSKNELKNMAMYDQQLGRYTDWAKQHSGVLPTTPQNIAIINQGKTLAKALQSTYREASLNTVYRPGEQGLLSQTIPDDPTQFLNKWRVIPQLDALRAENQAKLQGAAKLEGLQGYVGFGNQQKSQTQVGASQHSQAEAWAKANPADPRSAKILKALGK